jgi:hypothetical protein
MNRMKQEEPTAASAGSVGGTPRRWGGRRWTDVGLSALLMLVVALPTMAVEEDWHGRPMIDQPSHLWVVAACLVAAAFLVGGAVAGYLRPSAAAAHATGAAGLTVAVLVGGALFRRLLLVHEGVPHAVAGLWFFGTVAALLLSVAGSQLGRWLAA